MKKAPSKVPSSKKESETKSLFIKGSKFGINGVIKMIGIILLFSLLNILIFIYASFGGFESNKVKYLSIVALLGFTFTILAGYKTYRYIIVNTFRGVYEYIEPFFEKVSKVVIDKSENLVNKGKNTKVIDLKTLLNEHYKKTPKLVKMGIIFIINRIPFVELLTELKEDMDAENKELSIKRLNKKMDHYINGSVFNENNLKWLYWLLPLNVLVQFILIWIK